MGQEDFCPAKKFRGQKKCLPFFKAGCTLPSTPIGGALVSTGTWKPESQVEVPLWKGHYGQWGWRGNSEGYMKRAKIGYLGTHRHQTDLGNVPYGFSYMYLLAFDIPEGAATVTLPKDKKVNPLVGGAGISAFPMSSRVVQKVGIEANKQNHLLPFALGANVSGQIASVLAGGLLLSELLPIFG